MHLKGEPGSEPRTQVVAQRQRGRSRIRAHQQQRIGFGRALKQPKQRGVLLLRQPLDIVQRDQRRHLSQRVERFHLVRVALYTAVRSSSCAACTSARRMCVLPQPDAPHR